MKTLVDTNGVYETREVLKDRDYDQDVYLYAKGWYQKTDMVKDLQRIYGLRSGIEAEFVRPNDIIICMSELVVNNMNLKSGFGKPHLMELISDLSPDNAWKTKRYDGDYDYKKQVISKFLSILSLAEVKNIPGGLTQEPSDKVLPLTLKEDTGRAYSGGFHP